MYSKLAIKNVKKSFKDYAIYFITLTLAVCVFYIFNSISSQQIMLDLNEVQTEYVKVLGTVMSALSIFISFILGFLIIYANNYIIKRRKKELGLYMTIGMDKSKISFILFFETLLIGLVSLVIGIVMGVFLSQGVAVLTAKMFQVKLKQFTFVFSQEATIKTIEYFGIIFLLVIIFNSFIISKYKVIDLIYGEKKNEELKTKNIMISVFIFLAALVFIGLGYKLIIKNQLMSLDKEFATAIILGVIGTLLFFMSLSGFALKVVQSNKKVYLKNLNMFVLRQINSKINTNYISMSLICLMLFVAIGMLSTGFSLSNSMNKTIQLATPYDGSFIAADPSINIEDALYKMDFDIKKDCKDYHEFKVYRLNISVNDFFKNDEEDLKDIKGMGFAKVKVIKLSDFNRLMEMKGKERCNLEQDQYAILTNDTNVKKICDKDKNNRLDVIINNNEIKPSTYSARYESVVTMPLAGDILTLIVNDEASKGLELDSAYASFNFLGDPEAKEKEFLKKGEEIGKAIEDSNQKENMPKVSGITKSMVKDSFAGLSTLVVYIGLYVGVIFLITCVAVLALQQLSEASDNIKRYKVLKNIGVDDKMINKAIFTQTLIYFLMPLALAIIHSIVGLYVANNVIKFFGEGSIWNQALWVSAVILVVYTIYFIATYNGAKTIVKKN